jgi:hypothetical protein
MSDRIVAEKLAETMAALRAQSLALRQKIARAKADLAQRDKMIRQNELAQKAPPPPPHG